MPAISRKHESGQYAQCLVFARPRLRDVVMLPDERKSRSAGCGKRPEQLRIGNLKSASQLESHDRVLDC